MKVKFRRLVDDVQIPKRATDGSACYDVYLPCDFVSLLPGKTIVVKLGFAVEVPKGYELQIRPRSGLATKGIIVTNSPGCVDSDYRGEVGVILTNTSYNIYSFHKGDRICQVCLSAVPDIEWDVVDELTDTDRGSGGFGHTGA